MARRLLIETVLRQRRLDDGRKEFNSALALVRSPGDLEALFLFVPRLFQGTSRTQMWRSLQFRVSSALNSERIADAALHELSLRIHLALREYKEYLREFDCLPPQSGGAGTGERQSLQFVAQRLREPTFPDTRKQKIFGIGLPKTGTSSLVAALNLFGFTALHFNNFLTGDLISDDDLMIFDALTDLPVCEEFEKYYDVFPNSKFIYTPRPVEQWTPSIIKHWNRFLSVSGFDEMKSLSARPHLFPHGERFVKLNYSLFLRYESLAAAYHAYDRRVINFFNDKPMNRFLNLDICQGAGWVELSPFLEKKSALDSIPLEE